MEHLEDGPPPSETRKRSRYQRKLTEKRRLQNRDAQRAYRERHKKKVQHLESLVAANRQDSSDPQSSHSPLPAVHEAEESLDQSLAEQNSQLDLEAMCPTLSDAFNEAFSTLTPNLNIAPTETSSHHRLKKPRVFYCTNYMFWDQESLPEGNAGDADDAPKPPNADEILPEDVDDPNISALRNLLQLEDTSETTTLLQTAVNLKLSIPQIVLAGLRSLQPAQAASPDAIPTSTPTPFASASASTSALTSTSASSTFLIPSHTPSILLTPLPPTAALASNAIVLSLSPAELAKPRCPSPFYAPTLPISQLSAVLASYTHLPRDLRPVATQITTKHHPMLDLLPFPVLRERAIELAARDPGRWVLLKRDLLHGGLVCWRGGLRDGGREGERGVPWEGRSWEAKGWFLRKWEWEVGGREGELWREAVWWREVRGEKG